MFYYTNIKKITAALISLFEFQIRRCHIPSNLNLTQISLHSVLSLEDFLHLVTIVVTHIIGQRNKKSRNRY